MLFSAGVSTGVGEAAVVALCLSRTAPSRWGSPETAVCTWATGSRTRSRHQQWTSRTQVRRAARTKLKGKGKHPLRYPQGVHHTSEGQGPVSSHPRPPSRIHLLNVEGTAVGCGWRPAASKVQELSVLDYMTEQEAYGKCERCFKRHGFPADWALEPAEVPTLQEDSNSSADSGSETDDFVDTQSETFGSLGAPGPGDQGDGRPGEGTGIVRKWRCAPSEMALSVCTPVLQFLRIVSWVAHEAHPALVI